MKISVKKLSYWAICLYTVIVLFANSVGDTSVKLMRVALVGIMLAYMAKKRRAAISSYCVWAVLFVAYNAVLSRFALYKNYAQSYTVSIMYIAIANILIYQYMDRENMIDAIWNSFIIGATLKALKVFFEYGFLAFLQTRIVENVSANSVGIYSALAVVFSLMFIDRGRKERGTRVARRRGLYCALALVNVVFVILSASRKAILFMILPVAGWMILQSKDMTKLLKNCFLIGAVLAVVSAAMLGIPFLYNLIGHRMVALISGLLGGETDGSTNSRIIMIDYGIRWFKNRPVFGYGLMNYKAINEAVRGRAYYAHNNYIELLVDCGIVGLVLYYSLYAGCLRRCWKLRRRKDTQTCVVISVMLSLLIGEIGMVSFLGAEYHMLLLTIYTYLKKQTDVVRPKRHGVGGRILT